MQSMGYHAIIEHIGAISHFDIEALNVLLRKAAHAANATVLKADFHDFGDRAGNTGVLMLAESHISIHTWPENNYAAIDIFVCSSKESVEDAISVLRQADKNGSFDCQILERKARMNSLLLTNNTLTNAEGISKTQNNRSQNEIY